MSLLAIVFGLFTFFFTPVVHAKDLTNSVIKIFVTSNKIDYYRPWQSLGVEAAAGSGAVIGGNRILTNAHVIAEYTFIQVKKDGDPKKYSASVLAVGYDCDLALLTVDDPEFFKGVMPLEIGELPQMQDAVTVLGYPQGGDKLSITKGVVSRIELISYSQSGRNLLTVQIDAAINPGNSGGPVIKDGKLVGIAMQVFQTGQNIGYMIPPPVISHFFKDLDDGRYDGFPVLGIDFDTAENPALRRFHKIENIEGGIVVTRVLPFSPAHGKMQEGDVVLAVDGIPIGEDGTFAFRGQERLSMPHLITMKQNNENVSLQIIRDGKQEEVQIPLNNFKPLIPYPNYFEKPPYYIYGGLVFTVLSADLLQAWGNAWWEKAPLDFTYYLVGSGRLNWKEKEDLIVLLNVLPDQVNIGYHEQSNQIVTTVNGQSVSSFKELVLLLNQIKKSQPFTVIETENGVKIILDNKNIDGATKEILERNNIPTQYSNDVAQWLNQENQPG